MWLESWIDRKEINNDIQALLPYLTDKNIEVIERYTYQNSDENGRFFDRQSCGGYLFDDVKYKVFNFDTFEEEIRKGKRMDRIAMELDIPISAAWDIWKMLNMKKMRKILDELYEEFPAFEL